MEIDRLVEEKRSQLKEAFAAHQQACERVAQAREHLCEKPEPDTLDRAQMEALESEERNAAARFHAISQDLAQLHRKKFGEWHISWAGPRVRP